MLGAGAFDRKVAVDEPIRSREANGSEVVAWAETFTARACIQPMRGRELQRGDGILAEMDTKITLRWSRRNARIDATWRMRYNGTIYNIAAPPTDVDMAHAQIEFLCKSGTNQG